MRKILKCLKIFFHGIIISCMGTVVGLNLIACIINIQSISTGSGWIIVWYFIRLLIYTLFLLALVYYLGSLSVSSTEWIAYKNAHPEYNNNDSGETENKTSNKDAKS